MEQILPQRVNGFQSYPLMAYSAVSKMYLMTQPPEEEMSAIRTLCHDIKNVHREFEEQNPPTLFTKPEFATSYRLALECWNVLSNEDFPRHGPKAHTKITAWYRICEERFMGWYTSDEHYFENEVRTQDVLTILHRWHLIDVMHSSNEGRGLDRWLKKKGIIPAETQTHFDQGLKKTVSVMNLME